MFDKAAVQIYRGVRCHAFEKNGDALVFIRLVYKKFFYVPRVIVRQKSQRAVVLFVGNALYHVIVRKIYAPPILYVMMYV